MSFRMAASGNRLLAVLITTALVLSPIAEAKRLGSGRSTGSQRTMSRNAPPPQQPAQAAPQQAPAPAPQRSGVGTALAGAAAGAAVGGMAGYMMGKSANASGASQGGESSIPWGWILLLGALTLGGVMLFRRRIQQQTAYATPAAAGAANWQSQQAAPERVFRMGEGMSSPAAATSSVTRLPDGTESAAFLRQARASFLHMQALNSPEQLEELRKYLTPTMFEELKGDISSNLDVAEFPELNVVLADTGNENGQLFASARFTGRVSEALNAPTVAFEEVWHFIKPRADDPRWLLAGIQQA